jgi:hypothetical protein
MLIPVGLALGALSGVSSLLESAASGLAKAGGNDPLSALAQAFAGDQPPADPAGRPAAGRFDSGTLAALISLQGQSSTGTVNAASGLFAKLDADGNGAIGKGEFESALGSAGVDANGADALFGRLDANGDGSISRSELSSPASYLHHDRAGGIGRASSLLNATGADGSKTQTSTNPDGSTTTTITYADGSTVSTTAPAPQASGSGTLNRGNLLEQLIKLQAMVASPATGTTAAVA